MEKLLITGSTGFVGKNLIRELSQNTDYEIHVMERYVTGRMTNYTNCQKEMVNITDLASVRHLIKTLKPSYVINLAAISPVSYSYDHPLEVIENNLLGSVNLAESCRIENPYFRQFITASTSEVYGMLLKNSKHKLHESGITNEYGIKSEAPPQPNSPYAVAKYSFDKYLEFMGMAYDFPYTIMRPFNTYGRLDNDHFFIESAMRQMISGKDKIELGEKESMRDWIYVDDHVRAYLNVIANEKATGHIFNFGTGVGYSMEESIKILSEIADFNGKVLWGMIPRRPVDAKILISDSSKAGGHLDWRPKYDFKMGLEKLFGNMTRQE